MKNCTFLCIVSVMLLVGVLTETNKGMIMFVLLWLLLRLSTRDIINNPPIELNDKVEKR